MVIFDPERLPGGGMAYVVLLLFSVSVLSPLEDDLVVVAAWQLAGATRLVARGTRGGRGGETENLCNPVGKV
ncbi:MAG: hypothetical protein JWP44_4297 [Mucilaginibacter sp.]|jgi:hypothetical protein|nr:hypothetical protein [Mucilaginibacter sp.]